MRITKIRRREGTVYPEWEGTDDERTPVYMHFQRGTLTLRRAPMGGDAERAIDGEGIFSREIAYGYDLTYQDLRRLVGDDIDLPDHDHF
jgi:hypothetical protein